MPRFLNKQNSTYEERALTQLREWQRGNVLHNDIDDECVPDFSCCHGRHRLASQRLRDIFVRDPASRAPMMEMFIAELPDEIKMLYDLPNTATVRLKWERDN